MPRGMPTVRLQLVMAVGRLAASNPNASALPDRVRDEVDIGCYGAMLHCMRRHLLTDQSRGTVALPADLRRRLHLDQENAQIQLIEGDDGRIELRPVVAIPADQAWFWTNRWQEMEREADADVAGGRTTVVDGYAGIEELLSADNARR